MSLPINKILPTKYYLTRIMTLDAAQIPNSLNMTDSQSTVVFFNIAGTL